MSEQEGKMVIGGWGLPIDKWLNQIGLETSLWRHFHIPNKGGLTMLRSVPMGRISGSVYEMYLLIHFDAN